MENKTQSRALSIFVILTIIFALTAGYLGLKLMQKSAFADEQTDAKEKVIDEKQELLIQLEGLKMDYDELGTEYKDLDDLFQKEKEKVEKLMIDIRKKSGSLKSLKKEVFELKEQLRDYLGQIQVLKERNMALNIENIQVKTSLDSALTKNQELQANNENLEGKVEAGSVLKAYDIIADAIRVKNNGQEIPVKRGKRADKIRACFILSENPIAEPGLKNLYIRIARPDGKVLEGDSKGVFTFKGEELAYSIKGEIKYENQSMDLCFYFENTDDLPQGNYYVDLFLDDQQLGTTMFTLQ